MLKITDFKTIIHLDFETFYSRDFSLSKMPTVLYVRDERFKVFGCSVALNDSSAVYMEAEEFAKWVETIDWPNVAVSGYNNAFDSCVLTQHYNVFPGFYICPQSAARAILPIDSVALKKVAPLLGLGEKGNALVEGATTASAGMADYSNLDNELARSIYCMLYPMLSEEEQYHIHMHIRMAVEPTLVLDEPTLRQVRDDAIADRARLISASGYSESALSSNPQFASIITKLGLTCPTKLSPTTGEEATAFSKGDDEFIEFMLAYPEHQHIWDARLASKSNINATRAQRFLDIATTGIGSMPFPLKYCGASTGRSSGTDLINAQNMPSKYKSNLRSAVRAPDGYVIVVVDSAGIEMRINNWFCGQQDKVDAIRNGDDIYKLEASTQFGIPVNEVTKDQRQFGKVVTLGCGFYMGATRFRKYCASGPLGLKPIYLSITEAYDSIQKYRSTNSMIPAMWRTLQERIHQMTLPDIYEKEGCVTFTHEAVILPSGRMLQYPGLMQTEDGSWVQGIDKKTSYLHAGILLENIVQALARDLVFGQALAIDQRYRVVGMCHDECLFLAPEQEAEEALAFGIEVFSQSPSWAPDLPVSAEGDFNTYYCK